VAPTSESDISSDESAGSSIAGTATWGKQTKRLLWESLLEIQG
jgi:hypothetical protein